MIKGIHHVSLLVSDLEVETNIYNGLGFRVESEFEIVEESLSGVMLDRNGTRLELLSFADKTKPLAMVMESHIAFESDAIGADLDVLLKNKCEIVLPIKEGTIVKKRAFVRDGSGNLLEILEVKNT